MKSALSWGSALEAELGISQSGRNIASTSWTLQRPGYKDGYAAERKFFQAIPHSQNRSLY